MQLSMRDPHCMANLLRAQLHQIIDMMQITTRAPGEHSKTEGMPLGRPYVRAARTVALTAYRRALDSRPTPIPAC